MQEIRLNVNSNIFPLYVLQKKTSDIKNWLKNEWLWFNTINVNISTKKLYFSQIILFYPKIYFINNNKKILFSIQLYYHDDGIPFILKIENDDGTKKKIC